MRYPDGQEVRVGDVVAFVNDRGVVIGSIDSGSFLPPFKADGWYSLGTGVIVRTDRGAFVHFADDASLAELSFVLEQRHVDL